MIVSFRQTYSDDRLELIDILFRDTRLIEFMNKLDLNIFTFHNCSGKIVEYFNNKNKGDVIKRVEIIRYNDIHYGTCVKNIKRYLSELNPSHVVFTQDDTFSSDNEEINFDEILTFAKTYDNGFYLDFCLRPFVMKSNVTDDYNYGRTIYDGENFRIYEYNTIPDLMDREFALNDFPYICTLDMLDVIYDNTYVNITNIWHSEKYNGKKFKKTNLRRYLISSSIFRNYNIMGRTVREKNNEIIKLKNKKFID